MLTLKTMLVVPSSTSSKLKKDNMDIASQTTKTITQTTWPDTRHKMHLVCVLFTFQNNTGHTDRQSHGPTDGPTDGRTVRQTNTTSYRDATAHLINFFPFQNFNADSSIPQIQTLLWQRGQHMAALERIRMGSNDALDDADHHHSSAVSFPTYSYYNPGLGFIN